MAKTSKQASVEALREFVRVIILAVIPVAVAMLEQEQWNWKLVGLAAAVAALRALDSKVHHDPDISLNGISPV